MNTNYIKIIFFFFLFIPFYEVFGQNFMYGYEANSQETKFYFTKVNPSNCTSVILDSLSSNYNISQNWRGGTTACGFHFIPGDNGLKTGFIKVDVNNGKDTFIQTNSTTTNPFIIECEFDINTNSLVTISQGSSGCYVSRININNGNETFIKLLPQQYCDIVGIVDRSTFNDKLNKIYNIEDYNYLILTSIDLGNGIIDTVINKGGLPPFISAYIFYSPSKDRIYGLGVDSVNNIGLLELNPNNGVFNFLFKTISTNIEYCAYDDVNHYFTIVSSNTTPNTFTTYDVNSGLIAGNCQFGKFNYPKYYQTCHLSNIYENIVEREITVYPIPMLENETINVSGINWNDNDFFYFNLSDLNGKNVLSGFLPKYSNEINLSKVKNGVYIMTLYSNNVQYKKKIIK